MARLSPLQESNLTEQQRAVLDAIRSGPRGNMGLVGPFGVYVRAPGVGQAAQALGAAVRFNTAIAENVKEVAICTVGAFYQARFEFAAHAELARKAGVSQPIIEALRCGERQHLMMSKRRPHTPLPVACCATTELTMRCTNAACLH